MIYVISLDNSQVVKIGYGGDPKKRVTQLQIGSPTPLILQWVHEGSEDLESHLHAVFKEHRIRGEWFDLTPLGDAVSAVQEAVQQAARSGMLKSARFRGPEVVHPAVNDVAPAATVVSHALPGMAPRLSWEDRFPPSDRRQTDNPSPKPGCIRAWRGGCLRPAGMSCDC
ncbi:GIY-YIG nuclease family protein [Streptomyces scabiei]|uniref:GIY-YIG nuclease family protein n=1 Tax=Streptomyces scabiei TaxID=1930 RepID=UPI0029BED1B1|nr:GIY-YIG nuclease family protein [Streptomyces scabiei]MDX2658268.1 GIY-YIG nuclease family protein [Streptomyces scabiei]MDX2870553.1 GIY-YIG nuclease family protein [Streptomyces scabiei]